MFFSLFCTICIQLMQYSMVIDLKRSKLFNIFSVDCQAHGHFCGQQGVRGYPTIRAYPHGGQVQHK